MAKGTATHNNSRYIPALDGLRALAVIAVILYHLFPATFRGGYLGVDIFFVISGFLITTLLIGDYLQTGRITLKKFWIRRARRLLPALFTTILVIGSVIFFIRGDIMVGIGQQILGAATFSSNWVEIAVGTDYFAAGTAHIFMNFWSLAVEEQFYLLWPFITFILVAKIKRPWIGLIVTAFMTLASAGWMAFLYLQGSSGSRVYYGTDTHIFGLMLGASLAYLSYATTRKKILRRLLQPFAFVRSSSLWPDVLGTGALIGLGYLIMSLSDQSAFTYTGGLLLASVAAGILLVAAVGKRGILHHLFETSPLRYIGSRSYGIYLWHWPLIVLSHLLLPEIPFWFTAVIVLIGTFTCAELSYRFIETPVRRFGFQAAIKKLVTHPPATPGASVVPIRHKPYSLAVLTLLALVLTVASVLTAPTKTSAQLRIEAGERLVKKQAEEAQEKAAKSPPAPRIITDGNNITAIGDSVLLASSSALQARYPGILIDAEVSRSMRRGGLETVQRLKAGGQLRDIVIIGLGTNGYFGAGNLDLLLSELAGHKIILVTAHANREWTAPNNQDMEAAAKKNNHVRVAEWDAAISPHPDMLSDDGIHPTVQGDAFYIQAVATALSTL